MMHHSILAYICTPGEVVVLHSIQEADLQDGSPGVVQGIRKGQVEVKLLHSGRSVLIYPENFLDSNEESGDDESLADDDFDEFDDDFIDDDGESTAMSEQFPTFKTNHDTVKKLVRTRSDGHPNKKQRVFIPSPAMIYHSHKHSQSSTLLAVSGNTASSMVHNSAGEVYDHPLHSSMVGNIFLTPNPLFPEEDLPKLTREGEEEEAVHWLRTIRQEIEQDNLGHAELVLRDILRYHQYCTAAWVELAAILRKKRDFHGVVHCIRKAVTQCPLKTDFQTFADTIQMYLVATRLLSSLDNDIHENLLHDTSTARCVNLHTLQLPIAPSAMSPTCATGGYHDSIGVASPAVPNATTFPGATTNIGSVSLSSTLPTDGTPSEPSSQSERLWLQLRALVRAINITRLAGMQIVFMPHSTVPAADTITSSRASTLKFITHTTRNPADKHIPQIHFTTSAQPYLRWFVASVFCEMARVLNELADVYQAVSRPNNCLAGAYSMLCLCESLHIVNNSGLEGGDVWKIADNSVGEVIPQEARESADDAARSIDIEKLRNAFSELLVLVEGKLREEGALR